MTRTRVAVLFGGRSGEHPVSCISAASVLAQLDRERFEAVAVGITRSGRWLQMAVDELPAASGRELPEVTEGLAAVLRVDTESTALAVPADGRALDVDVVFPVLHGPYGEDGTLQGLLELADLPYVGCGVLASSVAMDKEFTKRLLASAGLRIAPFLVVRGRELPSDDEIAALGLPLFIKPARAGSSLGVSRVDDLVDLPAAIAEAQLHDPKVLIESAVPGREIECGVLEYPDGRIGASPTAEIRVADNRFYDFDAKYLDDVSTFDIPAGVGDELNDAIRAAAVIAFRAIEAQGLARVDFFVGDDGRITVNEINTMPGFTPISMYPRMWAAGGVDYPTLLTTLIDTALARGTGLR